MLNNQLESQVPKLWRDRLQILQRYRTMPHHDPTPNESVEDVVDEALRGEVPRRDFLRRVVLLGLTSSAAYKLLDETTAQAQTGGTPKITTFAIGEEGSPSPNPPSYPPRSKATTYAVGEESIRPPTTLSYGMGEEGTRPSTTWAVGEEPPRRPTPAPSTMAVGEEGKPTATTRATGEEGRPPVSPTTSRVGEESSVTTNAFGEESAGGSRPTTFAVGEEGSPSPNPGQGSNPSTMALGEEGSSTKPQYKKPSSFRQRFRLPWKNFRRW